MRIENPRELEFQNNFVIGLPSRQTPSAYFELVAVGGFGGVVMDGLRITGTMFDAQGAGKFTPDLVAFAINESSPGSFFARGTTPGGRGALVNSVVAGNTFNRVKGRASRLRVSLTQLTPSTVWAFDLCGSVLLGPFPGGSPRAFGLFGHLQHSLRVNATASAPGSLFARTAISSVDACTVTVMSDVPVAGTVYLDADQSFESFEYLG